MTPCRGDPCATTAYPRSGHTSTIDHAHIRESPQVRHRRFYHSATPPI